LDRSFRGPGLWESLRELLTGSRRLLDCLQVEITTRCPGRCRYCPHTLLARRWRTADMAWETFTRLWPLMRRAGRVHLQGWGEPLLHPDFFKMAALARKAGCAVSTTTCGIGISAALARDIVESGLDIVAFSLTGTDERSNAVRGGLPFQEVCAAIDQLQTVRRERQGVHLEIHLAYLMLASDMEAVRALPALMQRLGVHAAVVSTLDYLAAPQLSTEAFGPHETEKLARARDLLEQAAEETRRLGLSLHYALPDPAAPGTRCRENIDHTLFVGVDGAMSPCVFSNLPLEGDDPGRRVFGNVNDQDPLAIWESEAWRLFRESLACGRPDPRCRDCVKRFEV
jgi:MoaA/NifB/PqqE/SkfB family radical SAM enzyme